MSYSPNIAIAYAITVVVMVLHLVFLWIYSGVARARSGTATNPEDGARYGKAVLENDPPAVARVLRAHANAAALSYPFLFLGAAYVLLNGNPLYAKVLFAAFVISRLLHSIAYLRAWQPARSLLFAVAFFVLLALGILVLLRTLQVATVT
jgi:uncharacterized MAPEG superfamily protein